METNFIATMDDATLTRLATAAYASAARAWIAVRASRDLVGERRVLVSVARGEDAWYEALHAEQRRRRESVEAPS